MWFTMGIDQFRALVVLRPEILLCEFIIIRFNLNLVEEEERTYYAAITTVLAPDMLGVNSAPIAMMSLLRYSRDSPV